ncbi:MAG: galactokinase [Ruminococcaceae bacterium]|nr:galactokinase [Oscillospiraceae bacterium]
MNIKECYAYLNSAEFEALARRIYGDSAAAVEAARERWTCAVDNFKALYGDRDGIMLFSTPGRTEIGGNHTDHNNGRVLAAAVNLDTIAVAAPNGTGEVNVKSEGFPADGISIDYMAPCKDEKFTSKALIRGVAAKMESLGYSIGGFDAYTTSKVLKGSGLSSSAAFEVLLVTIYDHLFNKGEISPLLAAQIAQYAENVFFGKPCGLMDQTACAYGGFVAIDFADLAKPVAEPVDFDFAHSGYGLVITDTRGDHANLNDEYAAIRTEMQAIAGHYGKNVLRECSKADVLRDAGSLRKEYGDRAVLRAMHFFNDNDRVSAQRALLAEGDMQGFLNLVNASGNSSWTMLQNCFIPGPEQGVTLGLAVSKDFLNGEGACRVHGGGFAGTIQAFVPDDKVDAYCAVMNALFGEGAAHALFIRPLGTIRLA